MTKTNNSVLLYKLNNIKSLNDKEREEVADLNKIKALFEEIRDSGERVLLQDSSFPNFDSVALKIDFVGDSWCRGIADHITEYKQVTSIPYTIQYTSLLDANIKIIREEDNPFYG